VSAKEVPDAGVERFSVSMEPSLLRELDGFLARKGYKNRSQGVRDIVRARFVQEEWETGNEITVATVNIVYDHHRRELLERLAHLQHQRLDRIVSTLHVHLDHEHCLEVLVLRGPGRELKALGDELIATRGVIHGTLSVSTLGSASDTARRHDHQHPHPHAHAHDHAHGHDEDPGSRRGKEGSRRPAVNAKRRGATAPPRRTPPRRHPARASEGPRAPRRSSRAR
jgi:CopG family transcriptional regulator, nickel-responsive regulator